MATDFAAESPLAGRFDKLEPSPTNDAAVTIPVTTRPDSLTATVPRPDLALKLLTLNSDDIRVHSPPLVFSYLYRLMLWKFRK